MAFAVSLYSCWQLNSNYILHTRKGRSHPKEDAESLLVGVGTKLKSFYQVFLSGNSLKAAFEELEDRGHSP